MTVPVLSAAKRLAKRSEWTLSNLELQKILYLAHMFYLGRNDGQPLVPGYFEAWNYGPVHPDLYRRVRVFGADPVKDVFYDVEEPGEGPERAILDEAYQGLGHAGPGRLVSATHRKDGAWDKNYVPGRKHCVIPNSDIWEEYRGLEDAPAAQA